MENLTNEQIVDIINFYKECGISEDMYLSRNGVLDIFSLIGMTPEFDEQGNVESIAIRQTYDGMGFALRVPAEVEDEVRALLEKKGGKFILDNGLSSKSYCRLFPCLFS